MYITYFPYHIVSVENAIDRLKESYKDKHIVSKKKSRTNH